MGDAPSSVTSPSLLLKVGDPNNKEAWAAFDKRYRQKISSWCLGQGLREADADDVTQEILMQIPKKMALFAYDPAKSFRAWLKTVTIRAVLDLRRKNARWQCSDGSSIVDKLASAETQNDLLQHLEHEFELELFEEAKSRVRSRVNFATWEAFRLTALENRPGKEVGALLGIKVAAVYVYRNRVQQLLAEEIRKLEGRASARE